MVLAVQEEQGWLADNLLFFRELLGAWFRPWLHRLALPSNGGVPATEVGLLYLRPCNGLEEGMQDSQRSGGTGCRRAGCSAQAFSPYHSQYLGGNGQVKGQRRGERQDSLSWITETPAARSGETSTCSPSAAAQTALALSIANYQMEGSGRKDKNRTYWIYRDLKGGGW